MSRPLAVGLMNQPLRLERLEPTPDGRGGWVEGWGLVAETSGRLRPLEGRPRELAGRSHAEVSHALYLPPGVEARLGDRVVMAGRRFRVTVTGLGHAGRYQKLLLREVGEGDGAGDGASG